MSIQQLTIRDLRTIFDDLFDERLALAKQLHAWAIYGPVLAKSRDALQRLPSAETGTPPLAAELLDADRRHDTAYRTGFGAVTTLLAGPGQSEVTRATLRAARDNFFPSLRETQAAYTTEGAVAEERRGDFEASRDALAAIQLGDTTLADLVEATLDAGATLLALSKERMEIEAGQTPLPRGTRSEAIGRLGRFETAVADELSIRDDLPEDFMAELFAVVDGMADKA